MATSTPNYGLHQWGSQERPLRTEFNQDFQKIDTGLGKTLENYDALPRMGYNFYELYLKNYHTYQYPGSMQGLLVETFRYQDLIQSMTGGLYIRDNALCLDGAGSIGTMTTHKLGVDCKHWSRVFGWVRFSDGLAYLSVNGTPLGVDARQTCKTSDGINCSERQFSGQVSGSSSASIEIRVECGTANSVKVYEYGVLFL